MNSKTDWNGLSKTLLTGWIASEHFERFASSSMAQITQAYVGVYSARPTSWLAMLARNRNTDRATVMAMEMAPDLVRIPGMRRSKFLLPRALANTVFSATRLPLLDHEWRLREVGLTLADYHRTLPELTKCAKSAPVRLQDIGKTLGLSGPQARACVSVATYDGVLIRIPPSNIWSSRWLYAVATDDLFPDDAPPDRERLLRDIARRYIEHYGPVTVDDLAWWLAVSKEKARSLVQESGASQVGHGMWISPLRQERFEQYRSHADGPPPTDVRFLPAWDPLVMGYAPGSKQRDCLGFNQIGGYDAAGNGRPLVLVGGRAVATWRTSAKRSKRAICADLSQIKGKERDVIQEAASTLASQLDATLDIET